MPLTQDPVLIIPDDEDGDSDIEILAYCLGAQDAATSDIELLPTPVVTEEEQENRRYCDRFWLAYPPRQVLSDLEKLNRMIEYLNRTPALDDPEGSSLALIQLVRQNVESDQTWPRQLKCPICKEGRPKLLLPCGCKHSVYHIGCLRKWHCRGRFGVNVLVSCPACRRLGKPIAVPWMKSLA